MHQRVSHRDLVRAVDIRFRLIARAHEGPAGQEGPTLPIRACAYTHRRISRLTSLHENDRHAPGEARESERERRREGLDERHMARGVASDSHTFTMLVHHTTPVRRAPGVPPHSLTQLCASS